MCLGRYGTSIQQGGVASRAGNLYDAVLGRRLSREVLNFGFAGNGHEDIGVAKYLVTLPAAVIVLDCLPNMNAATVAVKTVPLVKYLRANGHAKTPIVLAEIPPKCESDWFNTDTLARSERRSPTHPPTATLLLVTHHATENCLPARSFAHLYEYVRVPLHLLSHRRRRGDERSAQGQLRQSDC